MRGKERRRHEIDEGGVRLPTFLRMNMNIVNETTYPVLSAITGRWSPYRFLDQPVGNHELCCCLEAARWASSSYNDQPWFWVVAKKEEQQRFEVMVRCLLEPNRCWAATAGVLLLSVMRTSLKHNHQPNPVALHDLGQASAHFALQASELGLQVHQMGGINRSFTRHTLAIPEGFEPCTISAIGYPDLGDPQTQKDKEHARRQAASRRRKDLVSCVFGGSWGETAQAVTKTV